MTISYDTLLDAARQHFAHVAGSPNYTREARHKALELEREVTAELEHRKWLALADHPEPLREAA